MAGIQLPEREPPRVRRTLRIPAALDLLVTKYAEQTGMSINDLYVFLAGEALKAAIRQDTYQPRGEDNDPSEHD